MIAKRPRVGGDILDRFGPRRPLRVDDVHPLLEACGPRHCDEISVHPLALELLRARTLPERGAGRECACELETHPLARALDRIRRTGRGTTACGCEITVHPMVAESRPRRRRDSGARAKAYAGDWAALRSMDLSLCAALPDMADASRTAWTDASAALRRASDAEDAADQALAELGHAGWSTGELRTALRAITWVRREVALTAAFTTAAGVSSADALVLAEGMTGPCLDLAKGDATQASLLSIAAQARALSLHVAQAGGQATAAGYHAQRAEDYAIEAQAAAADALADVQSNLSPMVDDALARATAAFDLASAAIDTIRGALTAIESLYQAELAVARGYTGDPERTESAGTLALVGRLLNRVRRAYRRADARFSVVTDTRDAVEVAAADFRSATVIPEATTAANAARRGADLLENVVGPFADLAAAVEQARESAETIAAEGAAIVAACETGMAGSPAASSFADPAAADWPLGEAFPAIDPAALVPVGVNAPYVFHAEAGLGVSGGSDTAFGDTDAILSDLDATGARDPLAGDATAIRGLGVQFFRQPTDADTPWPHAPEMAEAPETYEVPVVYEADGSTVTFIPGTVSAALGTRDRNTLYWVLHDKRWEPLYEMFKRLGTGSDDGRRLQVVLTLLTLGQTPLVDEVDPVTVTVAEAPAPQLRTETMAALRFHTDHLAASVVLDDGTIVNIGDVWYASELDSGAATSFSPTDGADWAVATLDTRSRYKLHYLYLIGQAVGQLLLDLRDTFEAESNAAASGPELTRRCGQAAPSDTAQSPWLLYCRTARPNVFASIKAIEIFNEVNKDNQATGDDPTLVTAKWWARAAREAARGLSEALGTGGADGATSAAVDLWLPSLAMYMLRADDPAAEVSDRPRFADIRTWQQAFLAYFTGDAGAADLPVLRWFAGQDYHYYSYKLNQGPGPIARLYYEIATLNENLAEYAEYFSPGGVVASVCETAASTREGDVPSAEVYPPPDGTQRYEDPYPYVSYLIRQVYARDPTGQATFRDTFQAREVWRRLCVAAGSGAGAVAWHTHIADSTSNFAETGVREDADTDGATAASATTKPAWWSLQRINELLACDDGTNRGLSARLIHLPAEPDGGCDFLDTRRATDMVVIVEFSPARYTPYAYLILVDPSAAIGLEVALCASVGAEEGAEWSVWKVPTVPDAAWISAAVAGTATAYPVGSVSSEWYETDLEWVGTGPAFLALEAMTSNANPVLLLSSHSLEFLITNPTGDA